ncbi:MAG: hypothetical protein SGJ24_10720 [Chloroflexota bacterium]|nr:hypothetical protein [Chloroflexota bacterium]
MRLRWFFIALAVGLIGLGAASAQDETIYGIVDIDLAEVRSGPDFAYPTIDRIPLNTSVIIVGRAGDFISRWDGRQWFEIQYGAGRAWIYARLLRTSKAFNSIFPTGRILPRDRNGRVPDEFDVSYHLCERWVGDFTLAGSFMAGDTRLTVTYPGLQGASVYSVITISPNGYRTAFDSETTTGVIELENLPIESGTYTWRVAPYWATGNARYDWQQVCLLQTGGTFEKPFTGYQARQGERPVIIVGGG